MVMRNIKSSFSAIFFIIKDYLKSKFLNKIFYKKTIYKQEFIFSLQLLFKIKKITVIYYMWINNFYYNYNV